MKPHLTLIIIALAALCAPAACTKGGPARDAPKKTGPAADSAAAALTLTSGAWILNRVEYPKTSTAWATAYDAGALGYSTLTMRGDHTLAFADNGAVTETGTWKLSTDARLLALTYAGQTEADTLGLVNASTLRLTVPKQMSYNTRFYGYYRDTYILKR